MLSDDEFKMRLALYGVDEAVARTLQASWPLLQRHVRPAALEHFERVRNAPAARAAVEKHGARVADMSEKYVARLLEGKVGPRWIEDAAIHFKDEMELGLDVRNRAATACVMLSYLFGVIGRHHRFSGAAAIRVADAAMRVVLFDLANAIVLHVTEQIRSAKAHGEALDSAVGDFDSRISTIRDNIFAVTASLNETAGQMANSARAAGSEVRKASEAAQGASANVAETAEAAGDLSRSAGEMRGQVHHSVELAKKAVSDASHTNETVRSLSEAVEKIGSVVGVISDIAAQTNLLALNATIEAARAGAAGKGFAIVASEVKALANETAKATDEIGEQIALIQEVTRRAVDDISNVGDSITSIASISETIVESVDRQATAAQHIAASAEGAAGNAKTVSTALGPVDETISHTGDTAEAVLDLSRKLGAASDEMGEALNKLFRRVRA